MSTCRVVHSMVALLFSLSHDLSIKETQSIAYQRRVQRRDITAESGGNTLKWKAVLALLHLWPLTRLILIAIFSYFVHCSF